MVGDGIDDAPALTQGNVGIAIGAGAVVEIKAAEATCNDWKKEAIMPCHNEPPRKIQPTDPNAPAQPLPKPLKWVVPAFLVLVASLLLFEHRRDLGAILPWLLFAGCVVMHLFMHRGHGKHEQHRPTYERNHGSNEQA